MNAQPRPDAAMATYDPSLVQVQGQLPVNFVYDVAIKSPNTTANATVTFQVTTIGVPVGADPATAIG